MSNSTYTIRITDESGAVVFEESLGHAGGVSVKLIITQKPQPPSRSPLHPEAINMDGLTPGLTIRRHNKHGNGYLSAEAIVIGEPFKRGDKYGQDDPQAYAWMLPVVTTNYGNKLVQQDWFLADMGVVPYEHQDGSFLSWNSQNYTLATS